jgi:hypothetical protein
MSGNTEMTNKLPELAKACWIQPEYVTTGADGNPEYVYSDSIMAFYMEVRRAALLEAMEACKKVADACDVYDSCGLSVADACFVALEKLIKEI